MKNLNTIILSSVICLFLATGCSQQRYGHLKRVRVNQEAKTPERKKTPATHTEKPAEPVVEEVVVLPEPEAPETPVVVEENLQSAGVIGTNVTPTKSKQPGKKIRPVISKMEKKVKSMDVDSDDFDASSSWARLIIIGLILVLIAIILSILLPFPLAWLIYTIGAVLIVVGIILWLLEML